MAQLQFLPAVLALNLAVIIGLVLFTLAFGRLYCSVICPLGVYQDAVAHVSVWFKKRKKNSKPYSWSREVRWLRYGVWILFVAALLLGVQGFVALLAPYSAYGRIITAVVPRSAWVWSLPTFCVAIATLLLVSILAWKGGRTYCNTVCPVGTTLSFFSRFALFRPVIDADKCRNCKVCEHHCKASCIDISRHSIDYSRCVDCFNCLSDCKFGALHYRFRGVAGREKAAAETVSLRSTPPIASDGPLPLMVPRVAQVSAACPSPACQSERATANEAGNGRRAFLTGAAVAIGTAAMAQGKKVDGGFADIAEKATLHRDTPLTPPGSESIKDFYSKCTACQLCVANCPNKVLRPSNELDRLMQPEMGYERGWCRPECTNCSQVCPSGAINKISREEKTQYHIGTASINRELCVAENGTKCGNCARRCPTGAIKMIHPEGRDVRIPVVNEEICIGCGACEFLCPARPISAISVNGRHVHLNS